MVEVGEIEDFVATIVFEAVMRPPGLLFVAVMGVVGVLLPLEAFVVVVVDDEIAG